MALVSPVKHKYCYTTATGTSNIVWTTSTSSANNVWGTYDDTWRAPPPREFNRYVNGSDMLEEFLHFLGDEHVSKQDALELPIDLFIKWLIIRACEEDHETPPKEVRLELPSGRCRRSTRRQLRCRKCQCFVSPVRACQRCVRREIGTWADDAKQVVSAAKFTSLAS